MRLLLEIAVAACATRVNRMGGRRADATAAVSLLFDQVWCRCLLLWKGHFGSGTLIKVSSTPLLLILLLILELQTRSFASWYWYWAPYLFGFGALALEPYNSTGTDADYCGITALGPTTGTVGL